MNHFEVPSAPAAFDWYAAFYEHHAEQEQVARAFGDKVLEAAHHLAIVILRYELGLARKAAK